MQDLSLDESLLWGLREAIPPLSALLVIGWLASHVVTVSWVWAPDAGTLPPSEAPRLIVPVRGVAASTLSDSYFDLRSGGRHHKAIDVMAPAGTPVVAAADGVLFKRSSKGLGGHAVFQFSTDSSFVYYYAHLSRFAADVTPGTPVRTGDVLGYVGSSGNASTSAPHLHFAVWQQTDRVPPWSDRPVNPYPLLRR